MEIEYDESSNLSTPSQASSNTEEWNHLENGLTKKEIDDFIKLHLPPSTAYQTNQTTYCNFCSDVLERHKVKEQLRKCKLCNVKYRVRLCIVSNIGSICQKYQHDHDLEDQYDNTNGLPQKVKDEIDRLLQTNPKLYPRQVRLFLNNNIVQLGLENVRLDLNQVIGYVTRQKAKINPNDNRIETVEKYLFDHLYFETIDINKPFFFGFNLNDKNVPMIGNGTKASRLFSFCTTIKLIQMNCNTTNQNGETLFHIDGTYKITKEGYVMLVFGRSNPNRKIYPFVVGIISSEEQVDFEHFFRSVIGISQFFGINLVVNFLMQDAQPACSAAARACFPNVKILTCWFHLKQAVKKNITKNIEHHKSAIETDINTMHYSSSIEEFEYMKSQALLKWNSFPELFGFVNYFTGQWLNSQWTTWQLFSRPVGFSTTNNNIEGFNRIIKLIYTSYERTNVLNCSQMIVKMITDLSKSQDSFELKLKRDNNLIKEASEIKIDDFQILTPNSANWLFNGQPSYLVYSDPKYCSCKTFLEYGICRHFIALCKLTNREFDEVDREFVQLKKRGRPPKSKNGALNKN